MSGKYAIPFRRRRVTVTSLTSRTTGRACWKNCQKPHGGLIQHHIKETHTLYRLRICREPNHYSETKQDLGQHSKTKINHPPPGEREIIFTDPNRHGLLCKTNAIAKEKRQKQRSARKSNLDIVEQAPSFCGSFAVLRLCLLQE